MKSFSTFHEVKITLTTDWLTSCQCTPSNSWWHGANCSQNTSLMFTYGTHRALASVEIQNTAGSMRRNDHAVISSRVYEIVIWILWKSILLLHENWWWYQVISLHIPQQISSRLYLHFHLGTMPLNVISTYCRSIALLWTIPNSWVTHSWWKTGLSESFLGCPNYFDLSLKDIRFIIINKKFASFLFNHVLTYREVGRPSGYFGGHVGTPDRVMDHIWRLGDFLSTALLLYCWNEMQQLIYKLI